MKTILRPLILILSLLSTPCWAYLDVLDTGEIMKPGNYKLTGNMQAVTSSGGLNLGLTFDAGFQEEYGIRLLGGLGRTDYYMGGLFKWMPIPDVDDQPAVGFNIGLLYARWNDDRDLTFRFEPLISKKFTTETMAFTPYGSLPLGLRTRNSEVHESGSAVTWQLVLGSQVQIEKWKNLQFMGEIGLDLAYAISHVGVAAIFYFDPEVGMQIK